MDIEAIKKRLKEWDKAPVGTPIPKLRISEITWLIAEVERLQQWKKEALSIMPDSQRLGKLMGLEIGESVNDKIIPYIERLQSELDEMTKNNLHHWSMLKHTQEMVIDSCKQRDKLQSELDRVREQLKRGDNEWGLELKDTAIELGNVERENVQLRTELEVLDNKWKMCWRALSVAEDKLATLQAQLDESEAKRRSAEQRIRELEEMLSNAMDRLIYEANYHPQSKPIVKIDRILNQSEHGENDG